MKNAQATSEPHDFSRGSMSAPIIRLLRVYKQNEVISLSDISKDVDEYVEWLQAGGKDIIIFLARNSDVARAKTMLESVGRFEDET